MHIKWLFCIYGCVVPALSWGQAIHSLQSVNESRFPEISWHSKIFQDSADFQIYRSGMENTDFIPITTLHGKYAKGDSLIYWIVDTTLTREALYRYFITVPYSLDTLTRSDVMYGHNMGVLPSPRVVSLHARSAEEKKAIHLEWKLNYSFTVNIISLYRSSNYEDGYELVAHLPGDAESYTDPVEVSNEAYFYFLLIHDYFGYQSPSVRVHGIAKYSEKPIPPQNFSIVMEDQQAGLYWEKTGGNIIGYRVYRKSTDFGSYFPLTGIIPESGNKGTYLDTTVRHFQNRHLQYYVVSISGGFSESNPTDTLEVYIPGEIIKAPPAECDYVIDTSGYTMLIWTSQETDAEVKGYNVYCSANKQEKIKLNSALIPYHRNFFTDEKNTGTGEFLYEIETVSITNTPGITRAGRIVHRHEEALQLILTLKRDGKGILITGAPIDRNDIKHIVLYRQTGLGKPIEVAKLLPHTITYTDVNVKPGELYQYIAIARFNNNETQMLNNGVLIRY